MPWPSLAVGVGSSKQRLGARQVPENEYSLPLMGGTHVGSSKARPDCVIPDFGQVAEYAVEAAPAKGGHVLHDNDLRSKDANTLGDGDPEATAGALLIA